MASEYYAQAIPVGKRFLDADVYDELPRSMKFLTLATPPRTFPNGTDYTEFALAYSEVMVRISRLDPDGYEVNKAHVQNEFEKLSKATFDAAERFQFFTDALNKLTKAVEQLEEQQKLQQMHDIHKNPNVLPVHVIQEEPDIEELLG